MGGKKPIFAGLKKKTKKERKLNRLLHHHLGMTSSSPLDKTTTLLSNTNGSFGSSHWLHEKKRTLISQSFSVSLSSISFIDCECENTYSKTFDIINTSKTAQRYDIRFKKKHFLWRYSKIPGNNVAPGLAITVEVVFKPTGKEEVEDELIITSGKDSVSICVRGFMTPSVLTLPSMVDCGSVYLGEELFLKFKFQNLGGKSTFSVLSNPNENIDDSNDNSEEVKIDLFSISPKKFSLQPNEEANFSISFKPDNVGNFKSSFFLVSDNKKMIEYKLCASCVTPNIALIAVDDVKLDPNTENLQTISMGNLFPQQTSKRRLIFQNNSPLDTKFKWVVFSPRDKSSSSDSLIDVDASGSEIKISPASGVLPGKSTSSFEVSCTPRGADCKVITSFFFLVLESGTKAFNTQWKPNFERMKQIVAQDTQRAFDPFNFFTSHDDIVENIVLQDQSDVPESLLGYHCRVYAVLEEIDLKPNPSAIYSAIPLDLQTFVKTIELDNRTAMDTMATIQKFENENVVVQSNATPIPANSKSALEITFFPKKSGPICVDLKIAVQNGISIEIPVQLQIK